MEVLVIFSTAALRKVERGHTSNRASSVAARLAVANALNAHQQASLLPLTIAHSASLARVSRKREQQGTRFIQFNDLLDGKYLQLQERLERSEATRRTPTADADETQVQKILQENWSGDARWTHTILCGDEGNTGDPLQAPFDDVWSAVSHGGHLKPQATSIGLLEHLESRIQRQAERSQNWQAFLYKVTASQRSTTQSAQSQRRYVMLHPTWWES
jgi:hypothetical protein